MVVFNNLLIVPALATVAALRATPLHHKRPRHHHKVGTDRSSRLSHRSVRAVLYPNHSDAFVYSRQAQLPHRANISISEPPESSVLSTAQIECTPHIHHSFSRRECTHAFLP